MASESVGRRKAQYKLYLVFAPAMLSSAGHQEAGVERQELKCKT